MLKESHHTKAMPLINYQKKKSNTSYDFWFCVMIEEKYVLKLFMESDSKKEKIRVICGVH